MNDAERARLGEHMRQDLESTLEERINRLLHIDHQNNEGSSDSWLSETVFRCKRWNHFPF